MPRPITDCVLVNAAAFGQHRPGPHAIPRISSGEVSRRTRIHFFAACGAGLGVHLALNNDPCLWRAGLAASAPITSRFTRGSTCRATAPVRCGAGRAISASLRGIYPFVRQRKNGNPPPPHVTDRDNAAPVEDEQLSVRDDNSTCISVAQGRTRISAGMLFEHPRTLGSCSSAMPAWITRSDTAHRPCLAKRNRGPCDWPGIRPVICGRPWCLSTSCKHRRNPQMPVPHRKHQSLLHDQAQPATAAPPLA